MANFTIFGPFWVVFVFLTRFFSFFGGFLNIFWTLGIMGGDHGPIYNFALFSFFNFFGGFWIVGTFLGFWLQWRFGDLLGVLVNYKIPRGIKLVVWRVFERLWGVLGVSGRVQGLQRWVNGVLLDPYIALFAPPGNLVDDQVGFQTPHNSTKGQSLQGRHHWYTFGALGPLKGLLKCHYTANNAHLEP